MKGSLGIIIYVFFPDTTYLLKWGMGNCVEKPNMLATTVNGLDNNFVGWFRQDQELTNNANTTIGLAAGAAIL